MIDRYKKKSTGEIYSMSSTSWSSDGTFITIIDKRGVSYRYKEEYFKSHFERVEFDVDKQLPYLKEYFEYCEKAKRNILGSIAKRHTPGGYFHIGDIVFFTTPAYTNSGDNRTYSDILYGTEHPYKIVDIYEDNSRKGLFWINLERGYKPSRYADGELKKEPKWSDHTDISVPMYMDMYMDDDAFNVLCRYDTEY